MNNVYLAGTMGSGKSTVGKLAAEKLHMDFVDLDDVIKEHAEKTVSRIFSEEGEGAFRCYETQALKSVLTTRNSIVALGGGTLLKEENRDLLRGEMVIALVCRAEVAYNRCLSDCDRPLLGTLDDFRQKCRKRENLARRISRAEISTDRCSKEEAAYGVAAIIKEENCV